MSLFFNNSFIELTCDILETDKKADLNLALSQLQTHLIRKQIQVLDIQEKNLMRESAKLDMELQLLVRKRARLSEPTYKQW